MDLSSGMVRFMLKLDNPYSVTDAAEHSATMDEVMWPQLVTSIEKLDVLHAGKLRPDFRVEGPQVRYMIDFARRHYRAICIDLSGNMEKYSLEIMHESKKVFLVCTPEIPSLHLAREKLSFLRNLDLGDRVCLLLNRYHKRSVISPAQIEELLGVPVQMTFPNDYQGVHKALTAGKFVEAGSDLGKQLGRLAQNMLDRKGAAPVEHHKRFIEYFSILPARYSLAEGKKTG
jgi:Flp pilus assembly CpaE family ATPase